VKLFAIIFLLPIVPTWLVSIKLCEEHRRKMLQIADKYAIQVEIKGGHAWMDIDLLILTTNIHPARWYDFYAGREEQGNALARRFTKIVWFQTRRDVEEIADKEDFWKNYSDYE